MYGSHNVFEDWIVEKEDGLRTYKPSSPKLENYRVFLYKRLQILNEAKLLKIYITWWPN